MSTYCYIINKNTNILDQIKEQCHVKKNIYTDVIDKLYSDINDKLSKLYNDEPLKNKQSDELKIYIEQNMRKQFASKVDFVNRNSYQIELIVKDSLLQNPKCDKVLIRFFNFDYCIFIK